MDRFTKTKKGFLDNNTGIIWKSSDEPKKLSHKEALKLNTAIWRLPTLNELMSLVEYDIHEPLPGMAPKYYWSSSLYTGDSDYAWYVRFSNRYYYDYINCSSHQYVRLIRKHGEEK